MSKALKRTGQRLVSLARSEDLTTIGKRWRHRRNLLICMASLGGASQRLIADVFDLAHSRIAAILKEYRERYGDVFPDR